MMKYQLDDEKSSYKMMKEGETNPRGLMLTTNKRKLKDKKKEDDNKKQKPNPKKLSKQDKRDIKKLALETKKLLSDGTRTTGAPS